MKKILFIGILIVVFGFSPFAQAELINNECPSPIFMNTKLDYDLFLSILRTFLFRMFAYLGGLLW